MYCVSTYEQFHTSHFLSVSIGVWQCEHTTILLTFKLLKLRRGPNLKDINCTYFLLVQEWLSSSETGRMISLTCTLD